MLKDRGVLGESGRPMAGRRLPGASPVVLAMVAMTAVWGSTFLVIQDSVERMPVIGFNAARFAVASLALVAIRPRALTALDRGGWIRGVLLGLALSGTYLLQAYGLQRTSSTVSAFVTGMFVVLTPLITAVVLRRRLTALTWAAIALSALGLGLLTLRGFSVGYGELLTLGCAVCLSLQIVGTGEWVAGRDPVALVLVQLITVAVVCGLFAAPGRIDVLPRDGAAWFGVLYTGVLATALAIVVQTWGQTRVSATRIAVIMTMEPAWAALFGRLAGEALTLAQLAGAALVLAAMFLVELRPAPSCPSGTLGPPRARPAGSDGREGYLGCLDQSGHS